jgi:hypothetical protein
MFAYGFPRIREIRPRPNQSIRLHVRSTAGSVTVLRLETPRANLH